MGFKIVAGNISYDYIIFNNSLSLSKKRNLTRLRKRTITISSLFDEKRAYTAQAEIFDSDKWARPEHIYGYDNNHLNILYFTEGSEYVMTRVVNHLFSDLLQFESRIINLSAEFDSDFCSRYKYTSSPVMKMMVASPFSIALSECNMKHCGKNSLFELICGQHSNQYVNYINNTFPLLGPLDNKACITCYENNKVTKVPLLYTLDLKCSFHEVREVIVKQGIHQLKVKIDSNIESLKNTIDLISLIKTSFPNVLLYLDANQSFIDCLAFKNDFLLPLQKKIPDALSFILGFEEICMSPFKQNIDIISSLGTKIYLDENSGGIEDLLSIKKFGYGIALKATRPLSILSAQIIYANYNKIPLCVQDLTFNSTSLIHNVYLRNFISCEIGIESNYGYLIKEKVGNSFEDFRWDDIVKNGSVKLTM
ncbi:enolase-like domain-containing protein [Brenneria goodwinii]|uniref:hypothetical protein n=1 Tax=Brenneria goodwinii TaxID=1109412 RepID=UPI0036EE7F1D